MALKSIKAEWESYAKAVMTPIPIPGRMEDCKRSFYAGAYVVLKQLEEIGQSPVEDDEADAQHLQSLAQEIHDFVDTIKARLIKDIQTKQNKGSR